MEKQKLTVRLPKERLDFVKRYAEIHGTTVTEVIHRYLRRLEAGASSSFHPVVQKLRGLVPPGIDAEREYYDHLVSKHR